MNDFFEFIKKNWLLISFTIFELYLLYYFITGLSNYING